MMDHTESPSPAVLSEFFDGELKDSGTVSAHVAGCPRCRAVLESYEAIAMEIERQFRVEAPEGLERLIRVGIEEEQRKSGARRVISFPLLLKWAAVLAVCSGVVFYALTIGERPVERAVAVAVSPEMRDGGSAYPYYASGSSGAPGGGVALDRLIRASYGNSPAPVFTDRIEGYAADTPARIESKVHQVWAVDNLAETGRSLREALKEMGVPSSKYKLEADKGALKLIADLSSIELVTLVKFCGAQGYDLASPSAPQPEQRLFLGNRETPVIYYAEFVGTK